jgi:ubiquitin C-terminal hydrolase
MKPYYYPVANPSPKGDDVLTPKINGNIVEEIESKNEKIHSEYQLSAIIVHEGSAEFGHYICYARPDIKNRKDYWLKLNDQMVSEIKYKDVCNVSFGSKSSNNFSKNAYLLFYTRIKS